MLWENARLGDGQHGAAPMDLVALAGCHRIPGGDIVLSPPRTRPGRSGTAPSPPPTTVGPWASSSCTTSPTRNPSTPCRTGEHPGGALGTPNFPSHPSLPTPLIPLSLPQGPPRSRPTPGTTPRSCWWGTSVTWRTSAWSPRRRAASSPSTWVSWGGGTPLPWLPAHN